MKTSTPLLCVASLFVAATAHANWPSWRGPSSDGTAPNANPPLEWSETKNVKWKKVLPGEGTATPIVWGDKVFILAALKESATAPADAAQNDSTNRRGRPEKPTENYKFVVLCLDRATGNVIWEKVAVTAVPHEGHHQDHGFASASPVTDGEVVLAYFGSRGLYCYDLEGNMKWSKDFGDMITRNGFGEGASPALHGNTVIVNWDDETDNDFIVALDKNTGKELWKKSRNEPTGWSTPLIVNRNGKWQVIVSATQRVRSYDLQTGAELWECGGLGVNAIPSPVATADAVFVMSGHREPKLNAISFGHTGDLTDTDAVVWSIKRGTPYVPSPVLLNGDLYFISRNTGKISNYNAKTGKPNFEEEQVEGIFGTYASLVATKDRIYVLGREGKCAVLKPGSKLEVLAMNKLDDRTDASIAVAGQELFIRGHESLYCIAEK